MGAPKGTKPWNAGTSQGWTDKRGYKWLYIYENGKRVARREHRVLMEAHLGRKLEPWELVHHKDGDTANNTISNLELMEWGKHTSEHHKGGRKAEYARRTMEAFALLREQLKRERDAKTDLLVVCRMVVMLRQLGGMLPGARDVVQAIVEAAQAAIAKAEGT